MYTYTSFSSFCQKAIFFKNTHTDVADICLCFLNNNFLALQLLMKTVRIKASIPRENTKFQLEPDCFQSFVEVSLPQENISKYAGEACISKILLVWKSEAQCGCQLLFFIQLNL